MNGPTIRQLVQIIPSVPTSDGAGVSLRRSLGSQRGLYLDPFLMLDEFFSDDPDDYLAGFPSHPHRGFETVTYMLDGHMRHQDHLGNTGDLGPGAVQWMTAARGIIHSEMPQQTEGRMRGFQLWINLPAAEKMKAAHYRDIPAAQIPTVSLGQGSEVRVIAGRFREAVGPINGSEAVLATDPLYLDVHLAAGTEFATEVTSSYNAFLYVYEGDAIVGPAGEARALPHRSAGLLSSGGEVRVQAGAQGARLLLLAARPLREPVVQYGPFVMNTREEIEQAVEDYRSGRLAATA
jgi:redox-sensitive bicupin YhaK (pirin superfamily)